MIKPGLFGIASPERGRAADLLGHTQSLEEVAAIWKRCVQCHRMPMRYGERVLAARGGMARAEGSAGYEAMSGVAIFIPQ